jgi:hypothetical protein
MNRVRVGLTLLMLAATAPAALAEVCHVAGNVVTYDRYFHDDTMTAADPTSPTAILQIAEDNGTTAYSSLATPTKINSELGRYGGAYTVSGSPTLGTYKISLIGTVPTSKTLKLTAMIFRVQASCPATAAALATLQADADNLQTRTPAALVGGRMDSSVGAYATGQAPGLVATVTPDPGNTSTITIPITETGTITASGQFEGDWLACGTEPPKEIVLTVNGTPDTIGIRVDRPFAAAPNSGTCGIWRK